MNNRLQKQKRRLVVRVVLIVLAAWLLLSAAFGAVCMKLLKSEMRSKVKDTLAQHQRELPNMLISNFGVNQMEWGVAFNKGEGQTAVYEFAIDYLNHKIADSNGTLSFPTGLNAESGASWDILVNAFVKRDRVLNAMTDEQKEKILAYCRTSDVPLVISRFYYAEINGEVIPTELQTVKTDGIGAVTEVLDTYPLQPDTTVWDYEAQTSVDIADEKNRKADGLSGLYNGSFENGEVLPTTFLLHEDEDIISQFDPNELYQLHSGGDEKRVAPFEYLMTAMTTVTIQKHSSGAGGDGMIISQTQYFLQHAERVNLWKTGAPVLLLGSGVLFVFFAVIALILIVLLWRQMKQQMEQERQRMEFSNALAHDIKTPLFVISGYAESLRDNINSEKRGEYAAKIMEQTQEVNALVHKMLDLGRLEAFDMKPDRSEWSLLQLTEEVCGSFDRAFVLTNEGDNTVCADRELMKRAVENLLDNAVKYAPPNSEIRVSVTGKTLSVSNACEPLDKAELNALWQPYARRDKNHRQDGNGLGLSIVKSVCGLHGFACDAHYRDGVITFEINMKADE